MIPILIYIYILRVCRKHVSMIHPTKTFNPRCSFEEFITACCEGHQGSEKRLGFTSHPEKMPRDRVNANIMLLAEKNYHISHMCAQFISQIPFAGFIKYPSINVYKLHYFYHISHY